MVTSQPEMPFWRFKLTRPQTTRTGPFLAHHAILWPFFATTFGTCSAEGHSVARKRRTLSCHQRVPFRSSARPFAVMRYFCNRLFGLSGMVYSISPCCIAGKRKRLYISALFFKPRISNKSELPRSTSRANNIRRMPRSIRLRLLGADCWGLTVGG